MQPTHEQVLNTLVAARLLLSEKATWTKRTYARNANRRPVHWSAESASCFCMAGAMKTCAPDTDTLVAALHVAGKAAYMLSDKGNIPYFNDHMETTLQDVQEALDLAICLAEPQY